jgi:transcriptional regulator with XRE-family HTH domain
MDITLAATLVKEARILSGLTQRELAERAGTSQPAVARVEQGSLSPTLATLERLLNAAGFGLAAGLVPRAVPDPVIERYKRDVDRTLLRENLRKTVDQRLRSLVDLQKSAAEVRRAGRRARKGSKK